MRDIEAVICVDEIIRAGHVVLGVGSRHDCNDRPNSEDVLGIARQKARRFVIVDLGATSLIFLYALLLPRRRLSPYLIENPSFRFTIRYQPLAVNLVTPLIERQSVRYRVEVID